MKAFPRDVTVQTMKIRHIGVESELGIRGRDRHDDLRDIEEKCAKRGLLCNIGFDGGGREFRTNPISVRSLKQVRGQKYLREYYEVLKDNTVVLDSGGTHIHISILNSDHPNMESNAMAMATTFFKQFQKIAGRKSSWAGRSRYNSLEAIRNELSYCKYRDRTYSMKGYMLNPTNHQTLEFRGGKGSNDCEEVLAWTEFLDNITKLSNRKSIEGITFKQLLKGKRIEAYIKSLKDWRKLTKKELEQKFCGATL